MSSTGGRVDDDYLHGLTGDPVGRLAGYPQLLSWFSSFSGGGS